MIFYRRINFISSTYKKRREDADYDFVPYLEHKPNTGAETGTEYAREGELRTGIPPQSNENSDTEAKDLPEDQLQREKGFVFSINDQGAALACLLGIPSMVAGTQ